VTLSIDDAACLYFRQPGPLKLPTLRFHKLFEGHAADAKMSTYVRYFGCVFLEDLHGDDLATFHCCPGDHERISIAPAFEKFLLLKILLKVLYRINFGDESAFSCSWRRE
jgi:hypothetical protein